MRKRIVKRIIRKANSGGLWEWQEKDKYDISCVFVFYQRHKLIKNILYCLSTQDFPKDRMEIILVEDRGGSDNTRDLLQGFNTLHISYYAPSNNWRKMGYMRNYGLSKASGEIVLFLDDDTVILDQYFLKKLQTLFDSDPDLMAVLPKGNPAYCLIKNHYHYHHPYFFTNRCVAYRRECLVELRGFDNTFIGQEDVELAIRFLAKGYKYLNTSELQYYHPPLIVKGLGKAKAVGYSFGCSSYPFLLKCLLALNGSRWLYRFIFPSTKNIYMSKFAIGFLLGFFQAFLSKEPPNYV